jgi:hypothetical protein
MTVPSGPAGRRDASTLPGGRFRAPADPLHPFRNLGDHGIGEQPGATVLRPALAIRGASRPLGHGFSYPIRFLTRSSSALSRARGTTPKLSVNLGNQMRGIRACPFVTAPEVPESGAGRDAQGRLIGLAPVRGDERCESGQLPLRPSQEAGAFLSWEATSLIVGRRPRGTSAP